MTDDVVERCTRGGRSESEWRAQSTLNQEIRLSIVQQALSALRSGDELPGRLVVVPKKLTPQMLYAGEECTSGNNWQPIESIWSAMLSAMKE